MKYAYGSQDLGFLVALDEGLDKVKHLKTILAKLESGGVNDDKT